jgi:UDP-GlcNAc:undecaprenyl-phosphate GlcNAc-1-phosphate transferase
MNFLYSLTVAFFLTIAIIPLISRFAPRLGLVDEPVGGRKLHKLPIPRTGGLGIILGSTIPLFFLLPYDSHLRSLIPSCAVIVLFGVLDDRYELSYQWKLFGQSLAAVIAMMGGIVLFELPFWGLGDAPVWFSYPLTFLFLVGVVNGVNFSDGLDGLAGGTSIMALLLLLILALQIQDYPTAMIALAFVGGVLGFLRFNTYPARIYMGDAGSQLLGFLIACLAIIVTQQEGSAYNKFLPVLLLGIPILDILQVIPVRIHKKLPLPGPDNEHFHHQLIKVGFRHYEVVVVVYLLQALLMAMAYFSRYGSDLNVVLFYLAFVATTCGLLLAANYSGWQFRKRQRQKGRNERRNRLLRKLSPLYPYLAKIVSATIIVFMFTSIYIIGEFNRPLAKVALIIAIVLGFVSFLAGHRYKQLTRLSCGIASILIAYLLSQLNISMQQEILVSGLLVFLALFLVLSIRMTRKDDFTLDTQDLLLLLAVVFLPMLPFQTLDSYSVSRIALTAFLLLYSVEFLINTGRGSVRAVNVASIASLALIGVIGLA